MNKLRVFPGRIFFDHLPKTAGQAINHWLRTELGTGCVTDNLIGKHHELIKQYGGEYSIISGHLEGDGKGLDSRYQYITQLREPVSRCVSWIFFLLPNTSDIPAEKSLVESAKRFIEGNGTDDLLAGTISNVYVKHFSSIVSNHTHDDNSMLTLALDTVKNFDAVGLYDDMQNFIADVSNIIGIAAPTSIAQINKSIISETNRHLSPLHYQQLIELNELDIHFYNEISGWIKSHKPIARKVVLPPWHKYDESKDAKVITSPDIPDVRAQLRDGSEIKQGQLLIFDVDFLLLRQLDKLQTVIQIYDKHKQVVLSTNNVERGINFHDIESGAHRVTYFILPDLPIGEYSASFRFIELLPDNATQSLALYDDLCQFSICNNCTEFPHYPIEIMLHKTDFADDSRLAREPFGCIKAVNCIETMHPSEISKVAVSATNFSEQHWTGDMFRPINLSYHWYDFSGNPVLCNELRTPLPRYGILPGDTIQLEMQVQAPPVQGQYILELTIVQEFFAWFEKLGFNSFKQNVSINA